jgi:8-oxo-dGTP pyrophosphatase MutT (NUDIX family)
MLVPVKTLRKPGTEHPLAQQIAALPVKWEDGKMRVLMVTSRGTGRWVMPKGWEMDGHKPWHAAEIEALEEAGAVGSIGSEPLGEYHYRKTLDDGTIIPVRVQIYPMVVESLKKRWKERDQRQRHWFSLKGAAKRVKEPELSALLLTLAKRARKKPVIRELLRAS